MEVALPHSSRIKTEAAFESLKLSTKSFLWNKWKRQRKVSYHRAVLGLQMHKALVSLSVCYVTLCRSVVQVFKNIQYIVIQSRRTFVLSDKNMVCWCERLAFRLEIRMYTGLLKGLCLVLLFFVLQLLLDSSNMCLVWWHLAWYRSGNYMWEKSLTPWQYGQRKKSKG